MNAERVDGISQIYTHDDVSVYQVQSPSVMAGEARNANRTRGCPRRVRGPGKTRSRTPGNESRMSVSSVGQTASESPHRSMRRVECAREA